MNNKSAKLLGTILVLLILAVPSSVFAYNSYNYNKFYKQGQANIANEKYDEAISSFNATLKYNKNHSEAINKQISLVKDLKISKATYDEAVKKLKEKKYLEAIPVFQKIKKDDDKRYNLSQQKISECKNLYINESIDNSKKEFANKKYLEGIKYLDLALKVDDKNEQVLKLKSENINLYTNDNIDKAKKEVATKRYEEAIKYLDLALKVDAKNEQAVKLKDEYSKAIQEAKSTAKNVTISKSNNSITTTNSNNNTKTQIKIPPITSTVPPVYNSSISVSHVYGTAAIKKEFTKMGFVFSSDTTALYDKNGIKIGLVNQGEYWQVTTKTWGDTEEDLFEDCMTIILGRDLAWDNLIYIDYALEIPNSQHTSPYVKTFINNDMLVVYVYVPK